MALCCTGGSITDLQQRFCRKSSRVEARCGTPRLLQNVLDRDQWLSQRKGYLKQGKVGKSEVQQIFSGKSNRVAVGRPGLLQDELERDKWLSQLKGYLKQGKVGEAEELMRKMQEVGLRLDLLSYNSMITVNGKADRFAAALAWFSRLEADKWLQPDAVTYRDEEIWEHCSGVM